MLVGMLAWLYRYDHEGSGRDVNLLEKKKRSAGTGRSRCLSHYSKACMIYTSSTSPSPLIYNLFLSKKPQDKSVLMNIYLRSFLRGRGASMSEELPGPKQETRRLVRPRLAANSCFKLFKKVNLSIGQQR